MREKTDQLTNEQNVKALHQKHLALAKLAEEKGDQVLSERHYQRAEYYLHAMKEPCGSAAAPPAFARASASASHSTKRVIKDFNLKRTYRKDTPGTREKPLQEGRVLPFRGHYLRRNRRGTQDKEILE